MRYARKFAQAQKREEAVIFQCYYRANRVAKMDGHKKNLQLVRKNLIEGDNDLTVKVWEYFLNVCVELDVDLNPIFDTVKLHPTDLGKGNGYRIPSKKVDLLGHTKRRQRRKQWREEFRRRFETDQTSNIIQKLRHPELRLVESGIG
jgi:hypothetical protein